ncbi:MAG: ABC transporter ATP-binding protein [Bacillota bacterium]|nr:ABC transporter ATP-binding protein [Bacillota bacterium]
MVLETRNLTKVYPGGGGCRDITLTVEPGEAFGLLGPNGAGKSTFIKMLVGLLTPTAGEARILGFPLGNLEARRQTGFLPENFRYHDWLTALELLEFHGTLHGLDVRQVRKRIPEVLALVGLSSVENRLVRTFSKGMQQRLGLAVALLSRPRLLFLDEPTSALDPLGRREIREIIQQLEAEGCTVFLNSHLLTEVERVCRRVAVIRNGRIVAQGRLDELLGNRLEVELHLGGLTPEIFTRLEQIGEVHRRAQAEQPGKDRTVQPGGETEKIWLRVDTREKLPLLAAAVVSGGGRLYNLSLVRNSLEELFVELMAGEQEDA